MSGGRGVDVVVVVTVYRGSVWLAIDPPSESDIAIMVPGHVDRLVETLRWAAHEAQMGYDPVRGG